MQESVDSMLLKRGLSLTDLLDELHSFYGNVLFAFGGGSLFAGFGNKESDIDILAVVKSDQTISQLPMMTFKTGSRIDTEYYTYNDLLKTLSSVKNTEWPPKEIIDSEVWYSYYRAIKTLMRFKTGILLYTSPLYKDHLEEFDSSVSNLSDPILELNSDWLKERICNWWLSESVRSYISANYIFTSKPLLGCYRIGDAVQCMLSYVSAQADQLYMGRKWLPQKLEMIDKDNQLIGIFNDSLKLAKNKEDADSHFSILKTYFNQFVGPESFEGITIVLKLAKGVEFKKISNGTIFTRWKMRNIFVTDLPLPLTETGTYRFSYNETIPNCIVELLLNDMLWLGIIKND